MNKEIYKGYYCDLAEAQKKLEEIINDSRYGTVTIIVRDGKIRTIKKEDTYLKNNV